MATQNFGQFDNTTPVSGVDYVVGYKVGTPNVQKRWLWSAVLSWLQGVINVTRLDRNQTNYVDVTGAGSGSPVKIAAGGGDANISLEIDAKGSGEIDLLSPVNTNGNQLLTAGGLINTAGGNINTGGGTIDSGNGNISAGTGTVSSSGGLSISGAGNITLSGTGGLTVATGNIAATAGNITAGGTVTANSGSIGGITLNSGGITLGGTSAIAMGTGNISTGGNVTAVNGTFTGDTTVGDQLAYNRSIGSFALDSYLVGATYNMTLGGWGLTADVTSVQGGGQLTGGGVFEYSTVANVGDCATLPSMVAFELLFTLGYGAVVANKMVYITVINNGANAMDVFPFLGESINALAANTAISIAAGAKQIFIGNTSGTRWLTLL